MRSFVSISNRIELLIRRDTNALGDFRFDGCEDRRRKGGIIMEKGREFTLLYIL